MLTLRVGLPVNLSVFSIAIDSFLAAVSETDLRRRRVLVYAITKQEI